MYHPLLEKKKKKLVPKPKTRQKASRLLLTDVLFTGGIPQPTYNLSLALQRPACLSTPSQQDATKHGHSGEPVCAQSERDKEGAQTRCGPL